MVTPAATAPSPESRDVGITPEQIAVVEQPEVPAASRDVGTTPLTPETPAPIIAAPTPTADQTELENLRREMAQVRASRQAEITQTTLQQEGQRVYDEEIAAGQSAEDALRIAKRHYATSRQAVAQQQEAQDKQMAAEIVGKKYSVAPGLLMGATSGPHMEEIAQRIKLEERIKALEQKQVPQVPAQIFNNPTGSPAGGIQATGDNIDKLWFDYETQHPGQNNPYEAAYRKAMTR